jgi:hypothetical protein
MLAKGLAIRLERERVDRVEGDPCIALQEGEDRPGGLLDAKADVGLRELLTEFGQPVVQGLGFGLDGLGPLFARAGVDEVEISLAIRAIQANHQVVGTSHGHTGCGLRVTGFGCPRT